jgi:RND family efflux transporter MFP subunit
MKRHVWFLLGCCCLLLPNCKKEQSYDKPLTPVKVEKVAEHSEATSVRYSANILPAVRVDLAFKVGGYVQDLLQVNVNGIRRKVQEGDLIKRGTTLAHVRELDYAEKVNQARSQLNQAIAAAEQTKNDFQRVQALFDKQSLTKREYDGAKAAFESAQARVEGAKALLEEANLARRDTSLRAPFDAYVMKRLIEVGSLVGPGTPGFVLADTSSVKAVFGAPDIMVQTLQVGNPLKITTVAIPGVVFQGTITGISPSADPKSRVFEVEVTVPNPENKLKVGMIASVEVGESRSFQPVMVVPLTAIVRSKSNPQGFAVFLVADQEGKQIAKLRDVELGDPYGNTIAVISGLNLGDRVIVRGNTLITDGEQVNVTR